MQVCLTSIHLKVCIDSAGAEISSVKNTNGIEFIWQGDKEIWARHAPVLFPIVGKLKDNTFFYNDRSFELPQHGFARDMEFELAESSPGHCRFRLTSNEETKNKYPFDFTFDITYILNGNTLTTEYTVTNAGAENMPFSVGAHPGFNCPLLANETFEEYLLEFENSSHEQTLLKDGLLSDKKQQLNLKNNQLPLNAALFDKDALVFENNQVNKVTLRHTTSSNSITMHCEGWPYFGIWSKKGCDRFICLEPWFGIADSIDATGDIQDKKGIISLAPSKDFRASFSCTFC
jgi:galactose mutarotase-like enzyme